MGNSRDLIDTQLRGRRGDRVGVMDGPWADTLRRWVTEGYPKDEEGNPVSPVDHFGYDVCGVGGWFDLHPLRGVSEVEEETDEWRVVRNGSGAALKWWKNKSGTPEHIDFRMTSREIWDHDYRSHLLHVDRARLDIEGTARELARRRAQGLWTHYGHLFIWEHMRESLGDVCLYESLLLDPDWIHDIGRVYTDFFKVHYQVLFDEVGLPDGMWLYEDLGYKNGLFCSPKVLAELIFPYYAELVAFFHSYDLPVVLHSCGRTTDALPLILEAGFDGLNPMEVKAGNDIFRFAEQYGDRLMFFGGLDARVLESGDRDLIRRGVTEFMQGMKARGARFVFASDHSLSTNIAYADYCYALEVYREQMAY